MLALRSFLIWLAIGTLVLVWLPLLVVVRLFDRDIARYRTGRMFRRLGAAMTRVNPFWTVAIEGNLPENPRNPYVVVANHQSLGDIAVISRLPWEMKWVAKAELFSLPIAGWMMRIAGDIPVDRGDLRSRALTIKRALAVLHRDCSVMFFPEGTRSRDARVRSFQTGAFRLAIESGVPILPIAIDGTSHAIPKHGWKFGEKILARVCVLPPVEVDGFELDAAAELAEKVRQQIVEQIALWRQVDPSSVDALATPGQTDPPERLPQRGAEPTEPEAATQRQ